MAAAHGGDPAESRRVTLPPATRPRRQIRLIENFDNPLHFAIEAREDFRY